MPLVPDPKGCDISVKRAIQGLSKKLGYTGTPTLAQLTLSKTCEVAAGLNVLRVIGLQTDDTALTGTLRGAYIDVSNGSTVATGTIRALELKARTEAPGDTGSKVNVLEGLSISVDSKAHDVTTMRAAEFILDGKTAGTIDEAVGLRIANNLQVNKATLSYGLQIYRDSFDYTYDISLSLGGHITGDSYVNQDLRVAASPTFAGLTLTNATVIGSNSIVFQPNADSTTFFQVLDADGGTPVFNVDSTNERVGIGIAAPTAGLDLYENNGGAAYFKIGNPTGSARLVTQGNVLYFQVPTAIKMTLLSTGRLGIGTTTPTAMLDIESPSGTTPFKFTQATLASTNPTLSLFYTTDGLIGQLFATEINATATFGFIAGTGIQFIVAANNQYATPHFLIDTSGNIGINELIPETLTEWTGTAPYLTLHNSTHEDTDGGGESRLIFKREDGAGTETACAQIEGSHDGVVANNQLGKMQLSVNTGAALVDVIEIDSSGNTKIGDAGTTNYLNIDSGGRLLLVGTAQTWEDLRIIPGAFQFPGVADPTLQSWQPGGAGTTYKVYKFLKNDEVHFTCQIPHNYKEGSDLKPHLHWTPCDRGNEEDGNTVGWKIDYSWANTDAAFASSTTVDLSNACSGIDDQHELTDSGTITGTNKTISGVLQIRLYRSDTGTDDTWVGATSALSPAILEFDLHYEIDSLGSDLELVKDAP